MRSMRMPEGRCDNMPTYNRVVYHEAKHETDVTAECTKIKLSTATLHTCRYVVSTAQDRPNQTSKQQGCTVHPCAV